MPRKTRGRGKQPTPGSESSEEVEVEGVMGDHPEDRTIQLLESIANGKQQLTQVLTQFFSDNQANQNQGGTNGNHAEAIHRGGRTPEGSNTYVSSTECLPGR
jgi:hypothetical protein